MDCIEMAGIATMGIVFGPLCRNKSPLGKRIYIENGDGSFTAYPSSFAGLPTHLLTTTKFPRAVILGTSPPLWHKRDPALYGMPPTPIVAIVRVNFEAEGLKPALASSDAISDVIPFYNEFPDGVSSKGYVEFAGLKARAVCQSWAGLCSVVDIREANVVGRTGYRPTHMGNGAARKNGFLKAVGTAEVVRVEWPGGWSFVTFMWWFDPGYLRYLRFRKDKTAHDLLKKTLRLLPDRTSKTGEVELVALLEEYEVSPLRSEVRKLVEGAVNDTAVETSLFSPYPSAPTFRTAAALTASEELGEG
ncbi:hypothetical protein HK101_006869, partial [Irineochytrium annulatum]